MSSSKRAAQQYESEVDDSDSGDAASNSEESAESSGSESEAENTKTTTKKSRKSDKTGKKAGSGKRSREEVDVETPRKKSKSDKISGGKKSAKDIQLEQPTCVILKPSALEKNLEYTILQDIQNHYPEITFILSKLVPYVSEPLARRHYFDLREKFHYETAVAQLMSPPGIKVFIATGPNARKKLRKFIGDAINPARGTLRDKYKGLNDRDNLIHCSDSKEASDREFEVWFQALAYRFNGLSGFVKDMYVLEL